jgi:hypothetical protein
MEVAGMLDLVFTVVLLYCLAVVLLLAADR